MKSKNIELDIDFIGGQPGLTAQEEKALSVYFAKKKQMALKRAKTKVTNRPKVTV
jgi:hypothetical protein